MGEPSNPHFRDFGISERAFFAKPIIFIFGETWIPQYLQEDSRIIFEEYMFGNQNMNFKNMTMLEKGGRRTIRSTSLINSWKSWIWGQYLPENAK